MEILLISIKITRIKYLIFTQQLLKPMRFRNLNNRKIYAPTHTHFYMHAGHFKTFCFTNIRTLFKIDRSPQVNVFFTSTLEVTT